MVRAADAKSALDEGLGGQLQHEHEAHGGADVHDQVAAREGQLHGQAAAARALRQAVQPPLLRHARIVHGTCCSGNRQDSSESGQTCA